MNSKQIRQRLKRLEKDLDKMELLEKEAEKYNKFANAIEKMTEFHNHVKENHSSDASSCECGIITEENMPLYKEYMQIVCDMLVEHMNPKDSQ